MASKCDISSSEGHWESNVLSSLRSFKESVPPDCWVLVGSHRIAAHKSVLQICSTLLSNINEESEVELEAEFDDYVEVVKEVINGFYCGRIELTLDVGTVEEISGLRPDLFHPMSQPPPPNVQCQQPSTENDKHPQFVPQQQQIGQFAAQHSTFPAQQTNPAQRQHQFQQNAQFGNLQQFVPQQQQIGQLAAQHSTFPAQQTNPAQRQQHFQQNAQFGNLQQFVPQQQQIGQLATCQATQQQMLATQPGLQQNMFPVQSHNPFMVTHLCQQPSTENDKVFSERSKLLYKFATFYKVKWLADFVRPFFTRYISKQNTSVRFVEILTFANLMSCQNLVDLCCRSLNKAVFDALISDTSSISTLSFHCMKSIVASDYVDIVEESLFLLLLSWMKSRGNRPKSCDELIENFRFDMMSQSFILENVMECVVCIEDSELRKSVMSKIKGGENSGSAQNRNISRLQEQQRQLQVLQRQDKSNSGKCCSVKSSSVKSSSVKSSSVKSSS